MTQLVQAESVTVLAAPEPTPGTLAVAAWKELQVNPGGVSIERTIKRVARNPLGKRRQREKGEVVDYDASPSIEHDLTKDLVDFFNSGMFLASGTHSGSTGLSVFRPTAVTSTGFTVAALGALTNNTLVRSRGFTVAGNNGIRVCAGTSTSTEVKTTGCAAETVSGYVGLLEVCGWRGASGDIGMDASGNLTSAASVFLSLGLTVGQMIFVGGDLAANSFATAAYRGVARVAAITAAKLTLEFRGWTVGSLDAGTSKLIDIYFGRFFRNVAFDHASSLTAEAVQPCYSLELPLIGAAAAAATSYQYGTKNLINTFSLEVPEVGGKITTKIGFVGKTVTAPSTVRATLASAAEIPLATGLMQSADHQSLYLRVSNNSDEASILVNIKSWSMMISNTIAPLKQQGEQGSPRVSIGDFTVDIDVTGYLIQEEGIAAAYDSRSVRFGAMQRNADHGIFWDIPSAALSKAALAFPESGPVTIGTSVEADRSSTYNYTLGMSTFPYCPAT